MESLGDYCSFQHYMGGVAFIRPRWYVVNLNWRSKKLENLEQITVSYLYMGTSEFLALFWGSCHSKYNLFFCITVFI